MQSTLHARLLGLVAAAAVFGAAACGTADSTTLSPVATTPATTVTMQVTAATRTSGDEVVNLVQAARPSVVKVTVTAQARTGGFGRVQTVEGSGTGFVVTTDGAIVTNNHVVTLDGAVSSARYQVTLADGRTVDASLSGTDAASDLAVLQIDVTGLTPLTFAEPTSIQVGQPVVAIGYALDLGATPTVTTGVVSATDRVIEEKSTNIRNAIQTDAAINPGNSGGPLLNLQGEVVGVNTAGLSGGGGQSVQGIFFAVSSGVAQPVVSRLLAAGT